MNDVNRDTISAPTDGSENATVYSRVFCGAIASVRYIKSTYADTADFTITVEDTAENVWVKSNVTASETVYPRQFVHDPDTGAESTTVVDAIQVAYSRIKIVIAQGGASKAGSFVVTGNGFFVG